MINKTVEEIAKNPDYQRLVSQRSTYSWSMTFVMLFVYFGFIYQVAFNKEFLARPIGQGVTTISIPLGIGVILFTIFITGIYVRRANNEFDKINDKIKDDIK